MNKNFWEVVKVTNGNISSYKKDLTYNQAVVVMEKINALFSVAVYMMRKVI